MEFRILGPLQVVGPAGPLAMKGGRQRRLLANLLVNANSVISSDHLIAQLWDDPPDTARQQLHNAVAALRRCLAAAGPPRVVTDEVGYRIELDRGQLDAEVFLDAVSRARVAGEDGDPALAARLLQDGLAQWRGPALAGLDGRSLRAAAARLDEQRSAATEQLFALKIRLGLHESVLGELTELVRDQPLREAARASLMLALYRSGRQSEALEAYREGRQILAAELGLDPNPELETLRDRILRGDRSLLGEQDKASPPELGHAKPAPPKPAFLPHGIRDFTGRSAEIDLVVDEIGSGPVTVPTIVTIDGMGGIGKTTLAVHLGHRLESDYPDGHYFVDLRGFTADQDPVRSSAALDLLLRAGGVPAELIQPDLDGRAAQWRSHLAGKRVLVVLDNAVDEAQVRPLLPGTPGVLVLITSRNRLGALESAIPVTLDVLALQEALDLFAHVSGRTEGGPEAADVVELCGLLPLAIRIAASRLRQHPEWPIAHLAGLLRDQRQRTRLLSHTDRSVTAVLELSYRHLDDPAGKTLRMLALHPGPDFDRTAVAALTGEDPDDADFRLDRLFASHLVLQQSVGRHQLHDLVRDFGQGVLERTDSADAQNEGRRRLFDYYLCLAHACCRSFARGFSKIDPDVTYRPRYLPPVESEAAAMELLKSELPNFVAITRYAIDHGWRNHAWQLPCILQPVFTRINYRDNILELFNGALAAARAVGSKKGESAALCNIGLVLRDRGLYDEVSRLMREAIALSAEIGDESTVAYLYANLGIAHIRACDLPDAEDTFTRAREIAIRLKDRQGYATFTTNLGVVASRAGDLDAAVGFFSEALEIYRDLAFRQGEAIAHVNIGEAHMQAGDLDRAAELLHRAIDISRSITFRLAEGAGLTLLATTYRLRGQLGSATEYVGQALALGRRTNHGEVECAALNVAGEIHLARQELADAEASFSWAAKMAAEVHLPLLSGRAAEGLAHVARARGDAEGARDHWQRALNTYPAGLADAANARVHLNEFDRATVTCLRCGVGRAGRHPGLIDAASRA